MDKKIESFSEKLTKVRKNLPQNYTQYVELGKIPPQAVNIEEAVLGALMLEKDALTEVLDILTPEVFYKEEHKEIYRCISILFELSKPVDILTVTAQLRHEGKLESVGGPYYISELTNRVGSSANIEYHSRILIEKFILRELIRISNDIQTDAYEETSDVFDLLDKAERDLYSIYSIWYILALWLCQRILLRRRSKDPPGALCLLQKRYLRHHLLQKQTRQHTRNHQSNHH